MMQVNFNINKNISVSKDYSFNLTSRSNRKLNASQTPLAMYSNQKIQEKSPLTPSNIMTNSGIAKNAFNPFKTSRTPNKVVPM